MRISDRIDGLFSELPSVVTIGKFDGVHLGHRELIRRTVEYASSVNAQAVVFTFDMAPTMILSKEERRRLLEELGVDLLIECDFTPDIITMPAERFVDEILLEKLKMIRIVTGEDFRFGYGREGNAEFLRDLGMTKGFTAEVVPEVDDDGKKISSTRIREALKAGDMESVERMLGFPYYVRGKVIHGRQIGRTIGIPTANLIPDHSKMLPPNGVYFSESDYRGHTYCGITNIGTKPTVDGHFIGVETFYFDCDEDLYDEVMEVRLRHFSRPETRFESLSELSSQIHKDAENGRRYFHK